jgi:hypothetical protein
MFKILRVAAGYNFVLSCIVVLGWIGYGTYRRLPLDRQCLGLRAEIGIPAWFDCGATALILLLVFLRRRGAVAWRLRLFFIAVGTWGFIWSVALPFVFQDPALRDFFRDLHNVTLDTAVGWYAFASTVAIGLLAPSDVSGQRVISDLQPLEK